LLPRANPQGTRIEFPSSAIINVRRSHRENAGLRGPVRTNLEEVIVPFGRKRLIATEYTPDGKVLTARRAGADAPEWISTNTYDSNGRLVKSSSGAPGKPQFIVMRTYDEKGRLKTITHDPAQSGHFEVYYDEQGRKTTIRTFDFKAPILQMSTCRSPWDDAALGVGVPKGGSVATLHDEQDQATELQVRDAEGHVINKVVRAYDVDGQITEERPILEDPAFGILDNLREEDRSQTGPEQLAYLAKAKVAFLSGKAQVGTFYTYDANRRLTKICDRNPVFEKTTTIVYNDQGDKAEERTLFATNHAFPIGVSIAMREDGTFISSGPPAKPAQGIPLPEDSDVRYAYQYDRFGNWIQQTMSVLSHPDLPPTVLHRTLSYYD
jgi:hypothetical protein